MAPSTERAGHAAAAARAAAWRVAILVLLLAAAAPARLGAQTHHYTIVATNGMVVNGQTVTAIQRPSVSDSGEVVFLANLPFGRGVISSSRGILARTAVQPIDGYVIDNFRGHPVISSNGVEAFAVELDEPSGFAIFAGGHAVVLPGRVIGGETVGYYVPDLISIDDHGKVFFQIELSRLFTQDDLLFRTPQTIAGRSVPCIWPQQSRRNARGDLIFAGADCSQYFLGLFTPTRLVALSGIIGGEAVTSIAVNAGLTDDGKSVFSGNTFVPGTGNVAKLFVDSQMVASSTLGISNIVVGGNHIAYASTSPSARGVYTPSGPVAVPGQSIGGKTVSAAIDPAISAHGVIAFRAIFTDGTTSIVVASPVVQIETETLPAATCGEAYEASLVSRGGTPPISWTLAPGSSLPAGFSLSSSSGRITSTGTPIARPDAYRFDVTARDSSTPNSSQTKTLLLNVVSGAAAGCHVPTPLTTQLVDPVPQLLAGNGVTSNAIALATRGRLVSAVAADGTTQVVLRLSGADPGETLQLQLPALATPSMEGSLRAIGSTVDTRALTVVAGGAGSPGAFVVYRAPADFTAASSLLPTRNISIQVTRAYGSVETLTIPIVRPPVVLVHGYAVGSSSWQYLATLRDDDPRFTVFAVDYGERLQGTAQALQSTTPSVGADQLPYVRRSHLGFTHNTPGVALQVKGFLESYRQGANPWNAPIASIKADVIAHSMGGLVMRNWAISDQLYRATENFGEGFIHKLITLGTPHFGSPQAILSLAATSVCSRGVAARGERYAFASAVTTGGKPLVGAAAELSGDGIGTYLSPALAALAAKPTRVPMALLAGDVSPIIADVDASAAANLLFLACPGDALARHYSSATFASMFDPLIRPADAIGGGTGRASDGSVPLTSALMEADAADCAAGICFSTYAHGQGTARFFDPFVEPWNDPTVKFIVDGSYAVVDRLVDLLNSSVLDADTWR